MVLDIDEILVFHKNGQITFSAMDATGAHKQTFTNVCVPLRSIQTFSHDKNTCLVSPNCSGLRSKVHRTFQKRTTDR